MSPYCDLDLEVNTPIFLQNILAQDDASPYQVWSQKVQQLRRYWPDKQSLTFWTFVVTLTLSKAIPVCHKTSQLMTLFQQTMPGPKRISSSKDKREKKSYFIYINPHCDLDLAVRQQTSCKTPQLMIMHHLTQFGYKKLSGSEDVF